MGKIVAILRQAAQALRRGDDTKGPQRPEQTAGMTDPTTHSSLSGAIGRSMLVVLVVMLPVILVPHLTPETGQALLLVALFLGAVVLAEYASAYPALIEFRFAAPFNRARFALLAMVLLLLSLMQRGTVLTAPLPDLVTALAATCGALLDLPFSPVRLLVAALPDTMTAAEVGLVRDGAALAMLLSVAAVSGLAMAIRLNVWPMGHGPFNVWINLPTFDPTAGTDVVARLETQARINISLGIALPFLIPAALALLGGLAADAGLAPPLVFVWGIALWAVVPAAMVMRGLAMARVARMIRANRRRLADGGTTAYLAA